MSVPPIIEEPIMRACEADDLPAITAIYAHAVLTGSASFELDPPDQTEMAARHAALVAGGYPYIVAVVGDEVVGYAYAGPYRPRLAYRATVENSVYVRDDCKGRGIGRMLMGCLIEQAEVRGYRQMVAIIGDSANQASIQLHEGLGFQLVGTLRSVGWKHGRWLDTVLMQRTLGHGGMLPLDSGESL